MKEPRESVCEDLDALLREVEVERVKDLQEDSSLPVVPSSPRVASERWRRLCHKYNHTFQAYHAYVRKFVT